jgi:septum site-determining protein MinC
MNARVGSFSAIQFSARSLLAFVLEPAQPLPQWFESLDDWLSRSPNFFASKPVILQMSGLEISLKEYRDLLGDLARRHIRVMAAENTSRTLVGPHLPPVVAGGRVVNPLKLLEEDAPAAEAPVQAAPPPPVNTALFVDSNLRSGQSIHHLDGDVIIVGRVASGAEIIAGGSVHIYGALQGRVIAGVSGAAGARIFCKEARAELLCIGGAYVTAEEMDPKIEGRGVEVTLNGDELKIRILN